MSFTWQGVSSDTMKFNITQRKVYNAPAFDVNGIEVPGRSGDILNSQNRFKNKDVVYTGYLRSRDFNGSTPYEKLSNGLSALKSWLCANAGEYHDLADDYDTGKTRRGYISGETDIQEVFDRPFGVTITVTFRCKPFMYIDGEPVEIDTTTVGPAPIVHITDGADGAPVKSLIFNIEPVQSGSGDPSPQNIRPISGWAAVNGAQAGKNVFTLQNVGRENNGVTYALQSDGTIKLTGTASGTSFLVAVVNHNMLTYLQAGTYALSGAPSANIRYVATSYTVGAAPSYTVTKIADIATDLGSGASFTLSAAAWVGVNIRVQSGQATNVTLGVQIEQGSTATAYSAPTITPITFTLGQTVYGGYVDAIAGKCYARPYYSSYSGQALVGPWISSHDKYVSGATPTTGAQVVDMGGTLTEISLTPVTDIALLEGENNIWCDSGDTTVGYVLENLENPTLFDSQPFLTLEMTDAGDLVVNNKTWQIAQYSGTLYCDSENMDWYDSSQLQNSLVTGDGFPELEPGENVIYYTGGINKVTVEPRFKTL